jgi:hypothetical protein
MKQYCRWYRKFDGHFTLDCTNETGQRANGNWKPDEQIKETKWNFKYCPYCGKEIKVTN